MEIRRYAMVVAALLIGAATAHAETVTVIQAGKNFDTKLGADLLRKFNEPRRI